jgi:hemerythrin-like domain-containing protein
MSAAPATKAARVEARFAAVPPVDRGLLVTPLDYLMAEHYRQRAILDHLDAVLEGIDPATARRLIEGILDYVHKELPLHIEDEERDLFPLLRRRAGPKDDVELMLALLASEHTRDEALAAAAVDALEGQLDTGRGMPSAKLQSAGRAFVETQRRHLAWENALVIPVARRLLRPQDLKRLGRAMAKRRGLRVPGTRLGERLVQLIGGT